MIALGIGGWLVALYFLLETLAWRDRAHQWQAISKRWEGMWEAQYEQTMVAVEKANVILSMMEKGKAPLQ
jgi:hypothetical protein